jgi:hypothetical protein
MSSSRAQTSASALLASVALFSFPSAAQPGFTPTKPAEREIAITGAADQPAAVVYGEPDVPLTLSFDAPLKRDAAVTVPGADVRSHPFLSNAIVITPSSPLAAQRSVPVLVPLADGVVALTLAFLPVRTDTRVRIVRRASSARPAATEGELQELASLAVKTALGPGTCANAGATAVTQAGKDTRRGPLVCGGGAFAYVRVQALADCMATTARLTRGEESADVLLVQQTTAQCDEGACWLVVARMPHGDGLGFELELFGQDGVPCHSVPVDLNPRSP